MTIDTDTRLEESPRAAFLRYAADGKLAYQVEARTGEAFFFPRVAHPGTGSRALDWRMSGGLGTVYASTTVRPRGGEPHNVSMVELDEGFRLMSSVVGVEPSDVRIGQRVRVSMQPLGPNGEDLPVFELVGGER